MSSIIICEIDNDGRGPNHWEYVTADGDNVTVAEESMTETVLRLMGEGHEVTLRSAEWWYKQHEYQQGDRVNIQVTTDHFTGPILGRVPQSELDPDVGPMYVVGIHVYQDEILKRADQRPGTKRPDRAE